MSSDESAVEWAKTAEFDRPVTLDDIVHEVRSRPLAEVPRRGPSFAWLVWPILTLPAFLPALGSLLLFANPWAWGASPRWSVEFTLQAFGFSYLVGGLFAVGMVVMWVVDGRRKDATAPWALAVFATTGIVTVVLLRLPSFTGPTADLVMKPVWVGAVGIIGLLLEVFLTKKSEIDSSDSDRAIDGDRLLLHTREEVLRILADRGVIAPSTVNEGLLLTIDTWQDRD